jgi:hypothetical protein
MRLRGFLVLVLWAMALGACKNNGNNGAQDMSGTPDMSASSGARIKFSMKGVQ